MQKAALGFIIATIVLATALPVAYVGTEGAWYLATGKSHFASGSTYRTLYAPLDWAGDRWPRVYEGRQALANGWLRLSGDPPQGASILALPPPWITNDNVQYFPPPAEFKPRRAAASIQYGARDLPPSNSADLGVDSSYSF